MSSINGDKARFHRIQKSKALRRERMRVLRKKLADAAAVAKVNTANTAQEAAAHVGQPGFFALLCEEGWRFATSLVSREMSIEVLLIGVQGELLACFPPRAGQPGRLRYAQVGTAGLRAQTLMVAPA